MPDFTGVLELLYSKLQNNTIYSGLKELYLLVHVYVKEHPFILKGVLTILILAIIHDFFIHLYTVKIYGDTPDGESKLVGKAMLKRRIGGYKLKISEDVLMKTDIPHFKLSFGKLLLPGIRNALLTVKSEGRILILTIDEGIDFVI